MITVKLTNKLKNGFIESATVFFLTDDIQDQVIPRYAENSDFEIEWKGEPDRYGLMRIDSISAESFADIAGTQNLDVEIIG